MSYDLWIADKSFNYTSNVAKLFYDHIPPQFEGDRGGLWAIAGLRGKQALPILVDAFDRIHQSYIRDISFATKYDAPNGWGSTTGALIFLARVMGACASHPRHKIGTWF